MAGVRLFESLMSLFSCLVCSMCRLFSASLYSFLSTGNPTLLSWVCVSVEGQKENMIKGADRGSWSVLQCCRTPLRCCHKAPYTDHSFGQALIHTPHRYGTHFLSTHACSCLWGLKFHFCCLWVILCDYGSVFSYYSIRHIWWSVEQQTCIVYITIFLEYKTNFFLSLCLKHVHPLK